MDYFLKRISEPSTWAGVSASIFGLGSLFGLDRAEQVAQTVAQTGKAIVEQGGSTQSLIMGGAGLLAGLLAMFRGEKGGQ